MKNKKLLLVATAAMGVLALGTAGVGTMAWWTANTNASATSSVNAKTVTVADDVKVLGTEFALTVTITPLFSSNGAYHATNNPMTGEMEMTEWNSSALRFGYVVSGSTYYQATQIDSTNHPDYWRYYSVAVSVGTQTVGGNEYSASQVADLLSSKTFDINLTRSPTATASLAVFYSNHSKDAAQAPTAQTAAPAAAGTSTKTLADNVGISDTVQTWYFGVYQNGGEHTTDDSDVDGNYTLTIAMN